jgi:5-methyltetrahydropteroyltriglutamate--homocysteine methyltransferase
MAFLTTTIGSFPKPPALHEARRRFADGEIDAAALREVEHEAVRRTVAFQDELGVSLLVDGEMDRADPITTFAERLSGIEIDGWVRVYGDRYVRKAKIVGPLGRGVSTTADRWRYARNLTTGAVKAIIPGPYSLMDGSFDEHYGSRHDACLAFADIVRDDALELLAAGARELQIDEPSAGAREAELPLLRESLERVVAPLRGRARVWLYLGYADLANQGGELATLPANGLLIAGAHCDYEGVEEFARALPGDRVAGIGVVDVADPRVETEDEIRDRLTRLAALIPRDRLWAVPDGGFRALRVDCARAKLSALVAAAREG